MPDTLHEDQHTFMIKSRSVLRRTKSVSDESCRENQNTRYVFKNFSSEIVSYEINWKSILEPGGPQKTIWRKCILCWMPKVRDALSEYVILIAFARQQCCANAPLCYVTRTLSAWFPIKITFLEYIPELLTNSYVSFPKFFQDN